MMPKEWLLQSNADFKSFAYLCRLAVKTSQLFSNPLLNYQINVLNIHIVGCCGPSIKSPPCLSVANEFASDTLQTVNWRLNQLLQYALMASPPEVHSCWKLVVQGQANLSSPILSMQLHNDAL